MANREQPTKPEKNQRSQRDMANMVGQSHSGQGNPQRDQRQGIKPGGTVGREVPDESKEHHEEIAAEPGRRGGQHRDDKR